MLCRDDTASSAVPWPRRERCPEPQEDLRAPTGRCMPGSPKPEPRGPRVLDGALPGPGAQS